jgi:hypothetical protein
MQRFKQIWCIDFEFSEDPNLNPNPICLVAIEAFSKKKLRIWFDKNLMLTHPPFSLDEETLIVAFYASAEFRCFQMLGWPQPANVVDLYVEFRKVTNGRNLIYRNGLLDALKFFQLPSISTEVKDVMRDLIISREEWSDEEKIQILDYCESDVQALMQLLPHFSGYLDDYSLHHGSFMWAVALIETAGVPIDVPTLKFLNEHWGELKKVFIENLDTHGFYIDGSFSEKRFMNFLALRSISWPLLPTGKLDFKDETFRDMANQNPELRSIHELRQALSKLRLNSLTVGADGRNRVLLSPYRASSSRNAPSTSKFIFGPSSWVRNLIVPPLGKVLVYLDYSAQELGIAAYLSHDPLLIAAYESGDPYIYFAKMAKAVPSDATKLTHGGIRAVYKTVMLAVQYGMGAENLAHRIQKSVHEARKLLRSHRAVFHVFWKWSEAVSDSAYLTCKVVSRFGWPLHLVGETKVRTVANFPMQANGAEMLRIAIQLAQDQGVKVCAPIHDAILVEAEEDAVENTVILAKSSMEVASKVLLGEPLRTDHKIITYSERITDERGQDMWNVILKFMNSKGYPACNRSPI